MTSAGVATTHAITPMVKNSRNHAGLLPYLLTTRISSGSEVYQFRRTAPTDRSSDTSEHPETRCGLTLPLGFSFGDACVVVAGEWPSQRLRGWEEGLPRIARGEAWCGRRIQDTGSLAFGLCKCGKYRGLQAVEHCNVSFLWQHPSHRLSMWLRSYMQPTESLCRRYLVVILKFPSGSATRDGA